MNKNVHAVAISASREKNGIKELYAGVKKDEEGFFGSLIFWYWYHEHSIVNISKLSQKMNEYFSGSNEQTPSSSLYKGIGRRPKSTRKKSKSSQNASKNDEAPNLKHIQMMEGDLLYSINTENPKLDPYTKIHLRSNYNDNNKKIIKILSCSENPTGEITWKVKIEENNRTIEISHAELLINSRDLFMEYCQSNFFGNAKEEST